MLAVLADDLTGACDVASEFASPGHPVTVIPDIDLLDTGSLRHRIEGFGSEGVVVNSQSRTLEAEDACRRVRHVTTAFRSMGCDLIFKKVDTLLRGHLAWELRAAMDEFPEASAIVAPAFPKADRFTRGGRQFVGSTPVHETELAEDAFGAVRESSITKLLEKAFDGPVAGLGLEKLRSHDAYGVLRDLLGNCSRVVVADAETDDDLERICRLVADRAHPLILVGSLGLAAALRNVTGGGAPTPARVAANGPALVIAGSGNPRCREQLSHAARHARLELLELSPDAAGHELDGLASQVRSRLASGRDVALCAPAEPSASGPRAIERALAYVTASVLRETRVGALLVIGGETAYRIARELVAGSIDIAGKLDDAMPCGRVAGGLYDGGIYASKGGGIGATDSISSILAKWRQTWK